MSKEIYKYLLPVEDLYSISIPVGAEILTVQSQNGGGCIWALVDPQSEKEKRHFETFGTGNPIPDATRKYIGTYQQNAGSLIWHVFELISLK